MLRNPIKRSKSFIHPSGDVMREISESDLNKTVAGAGLAKNSGGVVCTATAECYYGTLLKFCCPK
ncbi:MULTISPECIES: plantaricin C family lantibiotic [Peptoniphilaceae]|uniref:plantaricin C family lantibiotic n=1 Tax=Peptoniphilaceae TaxID=1570339 RepID=UPI00257CDE87|nr:MULTISPECIES: plantaricin C family lantibiotic [Peptoniphilaceae]HBM4378968.1 plantaricin C family lantibiotic [Enterococcus faecium]HEQ2813159.1 plantaricin C family lantibiotic [Streptococcus pyogenes]MBS5967318.1 plantaricin C family lantibiotic [Finegoldia magna]MBS6106854.1 plantaricin C family lantibiotic [Anaerococcus sp.]HBM4422638.1 plantaricin C family lantibiotic [Enterococcus faecium]